MSKENLKDVKRDIVGCTFTINHVTVGLVLENSKIRVYIDYDEVIK